jgi:hypothetical protein
VPFSGCCAFPFLGTGPLGPRLAGVLRLPHRDVAGAGLSLLFGLDGTTAPADQMGRLRDSIGRGRQYRARLLYYFVFLPLLYGSTLAGALVITLIMLALLALPITFGIAIFSARLWDIDGLINRTLIYGTLTASLALIYVGSILLLNFLFSGFTAGNSLAIVASTLAIIALFQPLHRRIQATIDRRFYRHKYDAARTIAAFSATLRHEVDLTHLSVQLVAVVEGLILTLSEFACLDRSSVL